MNEQIKSLLQLGGWTIDGDYVYQIFPNFKIIINTKTENVKLYKIIK
jgi:hypothetical protein